MNATFRHALLVPFLIAAPAAAHTQAAAWDSVGRILQTAPTATGGYARFNLPRRDITLRMGDVTVAASLALGTWAGFGGPPGDAMMMGDLVVTSAELKPVLAELARQRIGVTAVHNHLVGEAPRIMYVHFHGQGRAIDLAARLNHAIALTATPRPVRAAAPSPATFDTAMVFHAMGASGRANGNVAQVSFMLVPGSVTMGGHTIVPALGYGTPVNIQFVSDTRAVATGDFAVLGSKVEAVVSALATHGVEATAVHSHMVGETPAIYFIHFWADGRPTTVLAALRAAVDAGR